MKPADFTQRNGTLGGGPGASYGTADDVQDLPVHHDVVGGQIISCWALTWRERLSLLLTGRVWLCVLARRTHSPVKVTTESPFTTGERG
jgi:hypothetical protein